MPFNPLQIRALAVAVVRRGNDVLAVRGYDEGKKQHFCRLLGGGMEFGEMSQETLRREFREELGVELVNLRRLDVREDVFTYNNKAGHEILFIYEAELADKTLYQREKLPFFEPGQSARYAEWVDVQKNIVYPSIKDILQNDKI